MDRPGTTSGNQPHRRHHRRQFRRHGRIPARCVRADHRTALTASAAGARPLVGSRLVQRVSVVGVSGSGKSTLGRELAGRLAVPFVELDAIFHQPGWTPLPEDEFRRRVAEIAAGDGWVIDGNYSAVQPLVWERADTVVWV